MLVKMIHTHINENYMRLFVMEFWTAAVCLQLPYNHHSSKLIAQSSMADLSAPEGEFRSKSMDVSVEELVPCCGCICFITSCFTEWPDWFGCVGKRIFLCCYDEFVAYKILDENDKKWFHVFKGSFWLAPVKICCQVSLLQYVSIVFMRETNILLCLPF